MCKMLPFCRWFQLGNWQGRGVSRSGASLCYQLPRSGFDFTVCPACKLSKMPQHDYLVSKSVYQRREEGPAAEGEALAAAQVTSARSWGRMCLWVVTLWHDQQPAAFHSALL